MICVPETRLRRGVAAVEAAVCLPLLVLILVSAVEVSGGLFQQYDIQATAYELSKVALQRQSTSEDVQDLADQLAPQLGFNNYQITIEVTARTVNQQTVEPPTTMLFTIEQNGSATAGLESVPRGTLLTLTITADRGNTPGFGLMQNFLSPQISASCVFVKEY